MSGDTHHCSFVLLADFDIDRGAQLTYQFPQPLGTDEGLLANLMLPDGAEKQPEDWTIFFLNQTPFNTIAPVLALETPDGRSASSVDVDADDAEDAQPELLYVLNLVRTKLDKTARRGAVVKAMAICTRHSFIQVFKPVLLMALDDYFANPSQDCLARLFDAINTMDISLAPVLTRHEKMIMRTSERKDVFIEKFDDYLQEVLGDPGTATQQTMPNAILGHRTSPSIDSQTSSDLESLTRSEKPERTRSVRRSESVRGVGQTRSQPSPSEASFSLDGSAVWVNSESGADQSGTSTSNSAPNGSHVRSRPSIETSSSSSHGPSGRREEPLAAPNPANIAISLLKDSHFFPAMVDFNDHHLPIKIPLSTFPEEVGDYSLIQLVQTFSASTASLSGPLHPHLHTNGSLTPPIVVLFNALVTAKRIIFLGHHRPAGQVSSYVLSACALGSGCGLVLRGFIKRAFPYANLTNREEWESIPGYIAGVTNPIFEASGSWDLLCDVGSGRMVVSKDIHITYPANPVLAQSQLIIRTGTVRAEGSVGTDEEPIRPSRDGGPLPRADHPSRADSPDNLFMEDILSAISSHYGEAHVRARFAEYAMRFVRLAARYEEDTMGSTVIGFPSSTYSEHPGEPPRLGGGIGFVDEITCSRELAFNASRIEAWRRTESYTLYQLDFRKMLATDPIEGFDVIHQLWRLRHAKRMPDGEAELIMSTLADNVRTYDQITQLLSVMPPHHNGLLPLSFGLFHQQETVRDLTINIFNQLRVYPIGVQFLQALNPFQRYAYVRQAHAREARLNKEHNSLAIPPASHISRTPSHRSDSSVVMA
ncbi:spindle pole body interacting protein [Laetiporus sulphureus 93-53]|uniref:Spindle pole body interacting protein n=1 Tax=Laetiporus sulphureus 93-53 TaxID=1314785 RepID=A0A165DBC5_9APHY|nr:spindle pole body interacting protein [Laetiporus sulphureus 93-53]KZT04479.1 spindle pole body interacting protein [Laetiporus sulphureus 93-53]